MKNTVLKKWYIYVPVWLTLYELPLPAFSIFVTWRLSHSQPDLLHLIAAFPGTFLLGLFLFFPLFCIYFAVITTLHTLLDEAFFCSTPLKLRVVLCLLSVVSSALLIIGSIGTYQCLWVESWVFLIPVVLMILTFLCVLILLYMRLALNLIYEIVLRENKKYANGNIFSAKG